LNNYEVAADALRREMIATAPDLLGLDPVLERLTLGKDDHFQITLDASRGAPIPFLVVPTDSYRRFGFHEPKMTLEAAVVHLARARVWRKAETRSPPADIALLNPITRAFLDHAGVHPQVFTDATWTPVVVSSYSPRFEAWRDPRPEPTVLKRWSFLSADKAKLPPGLPWMAGLSMGQGVFATVFALGDDPDCAALVWNHAGETGEVRVPEQHCLAAPGPKGSAVRDIISHPVLDTFDLRYDSYEVLSHSVRLQISDRAPFEPRSVVEGNPLFPQLMEQMAKLWPGYEYLVGRIKHHLGDVWHLDRRFEDPAHWVGQPGYEPPSDYESHPD
jgi:hypothetical protein